MELQAFHIALKTNRGGSSIKLYWSTVMAANLTEALKKWRSTMRLTRYSEPYACYPLRSDSIH